MRLADVIGRWIGKVEIVLAGADDDVREGEQALVSGDPMRARAAAHRVLSKAPDSPIGLALLADAAEAAHLDAELALALEDLARLVPSQAEVWVRLARARRATQAPPGDVRDALVRALFVAESGEPARRDALLELADFDLAQGDGARAELWLERAALPDRSPSVAVRRAEARLLRGDAAGALRALEGVEASAADGRLALARGRALAMRGDAEAFGPLVRAMVLDVPGASESLSGALAFLATDAQLRARLHSVVDAKGEQDLARWRAAFARAEGARDAARKALREALEGGDAAAGRPLLDAAVDDRDAGSLEAVVRRWPEGDLDPLVVDARVVAAALQSAAEDGAGEGVLDLLARVADRRVLPWADALRQAFVDRWIPADETPADWTRLLARLDAHARALGDLGSVAAVADVAAERARPLRLAIVGEFNAGKSTFINALMGADVAPTGVLPTTATLHHLRWAPDPFARVAFVPPHDPPERIVPIADLRATLRGLDAAALDRVEILMPLELLVRVEILDTPGFNAPDPRHTQVALSAFEKADAVVWLLDATQAMKQSERAVLEEAERARLPVQILVNKADRLAPDDLARVLSGVAVALGETGIRSLSPPLAFSAKRALAGKLGDAAALEGSGWGAVEALLEARIVARHAELKERALRRRTAHVVDRLAGQASARAERRRVEVEASAKRADEAARAGAALERDAPTVAGQLAQSLTAPAQAWAGDLALVFVGRNPESAARDAVVARYRVERAVATLGPPLAQAMAAMAPPDALVPAQVAPVARALVRATVDASPARDVDAILRPLARAAVDSLVERLFTLSAPPAAPAQAEGLVHELTALSNALKRPASPPQVSGRSLASLERAD
jgi:GTP-binding protein EngB required for normal cell division